MLDAASIWIPCCMLLGLVAQSLKPFKLLRQRFPTFLSFRDHRSVAQQLLNPFAQLFQHCWRGHVSLRSWRYCVGARLKFWRRSRVPKEGSRDEAVEIPYFSRLRRSWRLRRQISLDYRELTKRGRRRLRGLHLKIQVRVIHITTKLFHVVSR